MFSRLFLLLLTSAEVRQTDASRKANHRAAAFERMSVWNAFGRMRLVLRLEVWMWALPGCRCCLRVGCTYAGTYPSPLITAPAKGTAGTVCWSVQGIAQAFWTNGDWGRTRKASQ